MPVYKYKSFEQADRAHWHKKPDAQYFEHVRKLFKFADQLNPIRYPRGIFKFKTIEEANRHREQIEREHIRELRRKRNS